MRITSRTFTLLYQKSTIARQYRFAPHFSRGPLASPLIQFHIDDDKLIRRQRLLEYRLQLFLARDAEAFGAGLYSIAWVRRVRLPRRTLARAAVPSRNSLNRSRLVTCVRLILPIVIIAVYSLT